MAVGLGRQGEHLSRREPPSFSQGSLRGDIQRSGYRKGFLNRCHIGMLRALRSQTPALAAPAAQSAHLLCALQTTRLPPSGPPRPGARLRQTPTMITSRFGGLSPLLLTTYTFARGRPVLPPPPHTSAKRPRRPDTPLACELVGHLFVAANPRPQAADPRASVACSQARLRLHVDRRPGYDRQRPSARRPRRTDLRLGRSAARPPRMQRVINSACPVSARAKTDGATVTS